VCGSTRTPSRAGLHLPAERTPGVAHAAITTRQTEERPDPLSLTGYCKNARSEISAVPTPGIGLLNPSPADGDDDVVLGVLGEDGPHLEVAA
jgi:hypothetical protein